MSSSSSSSSVTLKSLTATLGFPFGVAVGGPGDGDNIFAPANAAMQSVVSSQFDLVVAGNIMKMSYLEPTQNGFTFTDADNLVTWAQTNHLLVHGHTLIWHSAYQVPTFMSNAPDGPTLQSMLDNHIQTIVSHFATNFPGEVVSWDVVNEAFNDDGSYRNADPNGSIFYQKLGSAYIENAFKTARAADSNAKLYYNDYNIEWSTTKLNAVLAMVDDFKNRNIPIDGVGFQMHVSLTFPDINTIKNSLAAVAAKGLMVRISELDVAVDQNGSIANETTLDSTTAALQKQRYHDIVKAYLDAVPLAQRGGITVWGLVDGYSWLTGFEGHPEWPLLFNNDLTTKPAFDGVVQALQGL